MKLVKFEQDGCRSCQILDNILKQELNVEPDEVLNVSHDATAVEKASELGIMSLPVLALYDDDGNVIDKVVGTNIDAVKEICKKRGLL